MIKLLYQGHSSFRLIDEKNDTVIYIDPFAGEGYDVPADAVLVTHEHPDHNQVDMVPKKADCKIYRGVEFAKKGSMVSFSVRSIDILTFPAYNNYHDISECVGFIIKAGDKVLYFAGDTSKIKEMEQLKSKHINYAFLPIDGFYNMDAAEAMECNEIICPDYAVPIHVNSEDFLDMTKTEEFTSGNRNILDPSDVLEF